ncbi:MAG: radical SAM protein [Bacteroidales bacterium]|nr:radical SAM protein [Bacteroidales bacterium]
MMREETVFGPIRSRRLGASLGINLLPRKGKICNFDCIYCECGWNKDGTADKVLPTVLQVRRALEDKLAELMLDGKHIDSITFSGDGEPTLHPEFAKIVEDVVLLRDAYFPDAKVSVLSNGTRLGDKAVVAALKKVDNPILKLDAATSEDAALINRPTFPYDVEEVLENMRSFDGNFILQTMFLKGPGFDSTEPARLAAWMEAVRALQPRLIQCYSLDRPAPEEGLEKIPLEQLKKLVRPLVEEGFKVECF